MKKSFIFLGVIFIYAQAMFSQVGVGTTTPTAELEVETSNTGIPALELNPQTAPTGTTNG